MSKKLVVANWKMNGDPEFIQDYFNDFSNHDENSNVEVVFCPPFPLLSMIGNSHSYRIGAQDCHNAEKGAFTGEVSSALLKKLNVDYVILGHSERREYFKESNDLVCEKASTALNNDLLPIICVGETLEERENNTYQNVISTQIKESVPDNIEDKKLIIAYEPVWSIGTGKIPKNEDILEVFQIIREKLGNNPSIENIGNVRILYGGSVNSKNCDIIKDIPYLDGYLVGSASLKPTEFHILAKSLV